MTTDITYCSTREWCPKRYDCERAEYPKDEYPHSYCIFCDERCQQEWWCEFYLPKNKDLW